MVHLSRIYTRSGDDGSTGLGDGSRVPKDSQRVAAYGTVDECSSVIGLLLLETIPEPWPRRLSAIQNQLFDLGSDLCRPGADGPARIESSAVTRLEAWIDEANQGLPALSSFILPGGSRAAAWCHLARTVARRAERLVVSLIKDPDESPRVNPRVLAYMNRLSDLFFVLARRFNAEAGVSDVAWKPGE